MNEKRKEIRAELKETNTASREAMIEKRKEVQERFKSEIEAKRESAKQQFQTQRDAFKKRLETIKDETKKQRVEQMDGRFSEINTKRTAQMTEQVNKMDDVLTRVNEKIRTLESEGKDMTLAKSAVADAQTKIALAKTAITTQASKEYVIGVTSENKLGSDVSRSIEAMRKDLDTVQQTIKSAREAVTSAVRQVALVVGSTQ